MPSTGKKGMDVAESTNATRKLKHPHYRSFRLSQRIKSPRPPLLGAFRLFCQSCTVLVRHWRLFGSILAVYLLLNTLLVKGIGGFTMLSDQGLLDTSDSHGISGKLAAGGNALATLLSALGTTANEAAAVLQTLFLLLMSLSLIWALRQVYSTKQRIVIRDAFYQSTYPVVQFVLVALVAIIELSPMISGLYLYGLVVRNGIATNGLEQVLWLCLLFLLVLWSLYMITSAIFALYIVTLPNVRPWQALRSARGLVKYRRWLVLRKVVFLPLAILVLVIVFMFPIVLFVSGIAEFALFFLGLLALMVGHGYMYNLYRELIKDERE